MNILDINTKWYQKVSGSCMAQTISKFISKLAESCKMFKQTFRKKPDVCSLFMKIYYSHFWQLMWWHKNGHDKKIYTCTILLVNILIYHRYIPASLTKDINITNSLNLQELWNCKLYSISYKFFTKLAYWPCHKQFICSFL